MSVKAALLLHLDECKTQEALSERADLTRSSPQDVQLRPLDQRYSNLCTLALCLLVCLIPKKMFSLEDVQAVDPRSPISRAARHSPTLQLSDLSSHVRRCCRVLLRSLASTDLQPDARRLVTMEQHMRHAASQQ